MNILSNEIELLRLTGISGIIGSLLFIAGDLLYNHVPGSDKSPAEKMSKMKESRLNLAATLGFIGCWFYVFGSVQILIAFRPAGVTLDYIVFLAFAAVMIGYGICHTAYFAIASGARIAVQLGSTAETGGKLGNDLFKRFTNIIYIPVVIFSVIMLYSIVTARSMYPRWMAVFLPIFIYLIKSFILRILRGRLREIVNDSYDNLVLFIFYLMSSIVLWNGGGL
jgi:hypothetical protein